MQLNWLTDPEDRRIDNVAFVCLVTSILACIIILVLSGGCNSSPDYSTPYRNPRWSGPERKYNQNVVLPYNSAVIQHRITTPTVNIGSEDKVEQSEIRRVVKALAIVESNNNPNAIGDGGRAVGAYQIWPIMVREANRISGKSFTNADRLDPVKSAEMCEIVLTHYSALYGIENPVELGARWRNPNGAYAGWYMRKVQKALEGI